MKIMAYYYEEIVKNMESYDNFEYWFLPVTKYGINVYKDGKFLEYLPIGCDVPDEYKTDFEKYKCRPEFLIYNLDKSKLNFNEPYELFKILLAGAELMVRFSEINKNPDSIISNVDKCIKWLDDSDFKVAPASTRFHENYSGGLLIHTLNVVFESFELQSLEKFKRVNLGRILRCSLLHDFCKIGLYESYYKNVKNEVTGVWDKVQSYKIKEQKMLQFGHGVSSMYLATKFFKLSIEESYAIRWHMGKFRCSDDEVYELGYCNENYPIVYLLQFADQLSITSY